MKIRLVTLALLLLVGGALAVVWSQGTQRQVSLVVTNATIVTMDAAGRVIPNGALAVDGSDIVGVDTAEAIGRQFRGAETIDAERDAPGPELAPNTKRRPFSGRPFVDLSIRWVGDQSLIFRPLSLVANTSPSFVVASDRWAARNLA